MKKQYNVQAIIFSWVTKIQNLSVTPQLLGPETVSEGQLTQM